MVEEIPPQMALQGVVRSPSPGSFVEENTHKCEKTSRSRGITAAESKTRETYLSLFPMMARDLESLKNSKGFGIYAIYSGHNGQNIAILVREGKKKLRVTINLFVYIHT